MVQIKLNVKQVMYDQLSLDFCVSPDDLRTENNLFTLKQYLKGRRIYPNDDCVLQILSLNGKIVMSSNHASILAWCKQEFSDTYGAWICEFDKLRKIDAKLREYGHCIVDGHHYYIPTQTSVRLAPVTEVQWYEQRDLLQFKGDPRFREALGFDENRPDMLAVAAIENGRILGMAGASADSPTMWQIGIDVLPEARNKGIGAYLTFLLKEAVIKRGSVPFYGTGESHIQSQKIAINSGFSPSWWELYTRKL